MNIKQTENKNSDKKPKESEVIINYDENKFYMEMRQLKKKKFMKTMML